MIALDDVILSLTYEDVKRLIHDSVHKFYRKYGGDYEELLSEAHVAFMDAFNNHDKEKSKFTTWLTNMIHWRLLGLRQRESEHRHEPLPATVAANEHSFNVVEFKQMLSPEAREMVELVLDTPTDMILLIRKRGTHNKKSCRGALRELLYELGWSAKQIRRGYEEIREALS